MATAVPETEADPNYGEGLERDQEKTDRKITDDGKIELQEHDAWDKLGYSFPTWRKWQILCVVFLIQISINMNAAMYSHAVGGVHKKFHVSEQVARIPQMLFLVAYGFACEFWAPWSEEYGRWKIQQLSLFLINVWQIPCALAPNYATMLIARLLGGLSTAGGSVTLGVLADMWEPDEQEYAVAFLVLSSVGGSVVGTIAGSFIEKHLEMQWIFWILLIVGAVTQAIHFFSNPETRATILLDREAKRRRESGEDPNVYGPNEIKGGHKMNMKEFWTIVFRYVRKTVRAGECLTLYQAVLHVLHRAHCPLAVPSVRFQRRSHLHIPPVLQASL
jgi:MFS family permease